MTRINYWRVTAIVLFVVAAAQAFAMNQIVSGALSGSSSPEESSQRSHSRPPSAKADPWLVQMIRWYYPVKTSEQWEELFIRDFFRDRHGGFLLDVGASDYQEASTTYYLDHHLTWRGIAVDAIQDYRSGYETYRPRTRFFSFFVSDRSNQDVDFYFIKEDPRKSTGVKSIADLHKVRQHLDADRKTVSTITLNDLLEKNDVRKVDFLSMDIETAEPAALAGFDIDKYRPELAMVETHASVRQQVFEYFARHGYTAIEKYGQRDNRNSYFMPKAQYEQWKKRPEAWEADTP